MIFRILALKIAILLVGCAHQKLAAPSPVAVSSGLSRTGASVSQAEAHRTDIQRQNVEARTLNQRIHDKDLLIDRWRETHQ